MREFNGRFNKSAGSVFTFLAETVGTDEVIAAKIASDCQAQLGDFAKRDADVTDTVKVGKADKDGFADLNLATKIAKANCNSLPLHCLLLAQASEAFTKTTKCKHDVTLPEAVSVVIEDQREKAMAIATKEKEDKAKADADDAKRQASLATLEKMSEENATLKARLAKLEGKAVTA